MKTKLRKIYHPGNKAGNIVLRLIIAFATLFYLYEQLIQNNVTDDFLNFISDVSWKTSSIILLIITLILIPLNILLESIKWKYLIGKIEKVTLYNSIKAVLAGISVSLIMPNRVGDYLGRVFILKKGDRIQAVLSTILGSIAQLITTIIFGAIGIAFYYPEFFEISDSLDMWIYIGIIMGIIITVFLIIFSYLNFSVFSLILKKVSGKYYKKISKYSEVFSWYNQKELSNVLLLSMARYFVFSTQFFMLLQIFDIHMNYFASLMLISVIYISMAIIPTIAITEIGVRGSVSIFVFQQYFELTNSWSSQISFGVVSASSILWLANIILPAAFGALSIFTLKFFRKNNGN